MRSGNRFYIMAITAFAVAALFQNCGQQYDINPTEQKSTSPLTTTSDPSEQTPPQDDPPIPLGPVVCDPFTNGQVTTAGLQGSLYYLPPNSSPLGSVNQYISQGAKSSATIFLSQVNVPTRQFTSGFSSTNGTPLKDDQGNVLIENFALDLLSIIHLNATDLDGNYQFAILSDDGSILSTSAPPGGQETVLVNNDGTHSPKFACANSLVTLSKGSSLPIRLKYYQGPRALIALVLLWRRVDGAIPPVSKLCETNQDLSTLTQAGWKVLSADNFTLQDQSMINACTTN